MLTLDSARKVETWLAARPGLAPFAARASAWCLAPYVVPGFSVGVPWPAWFLGAVFLCAASDVLAGLVRSQAPALPLYMAGLLGAALDAALLLAAAAAARGATPVLQAGPLAAGAAALAAGAVAVSVHAMLGARARQAGLRSEAAWTTELERGHDWMSEQLLIWRGIARQHMQTADELDGWVRELRTAIEWLGQEGENWKRVADERQALLEAQQAELAALRRALAPARGSPPPGQPS